MIVLVAGAVYILFLLAIIANDDGK